MIPITGHPTVLITIPGRQSLAPARRSPPPLRRNRGDAWLPVPCCPWPSQGPGCLLPHPLCPLPLSRSGPVEATSQPQLVREASSCFQRRDAHQTKTLMLAAAEPNLTIDAWAHCQRSDLPGLLPHSHLLKMFLSHQQASKSTGPSARFPGTWFLHTHTHTHTCESVHPHVL